MAKASKPTAEVVHSEYMLGGVRLRIYTRDALSERFTGVGVLTLTLKDLEHMKTEIWKFRDQYEKDQQLDLPF